MTQVITSTVLRARGGDGKKLTDAHSWNASCTHTRIHTMHIHEGTHTHTHTTAHTVTVTVTSMKITIISKDGCCNETLHI